MECISEKTTMKTSILALLLFSIISCAKQNSESKAKEKLQMENKFLHTKIDSLNGELEKAKTVKNYWFDSEVEGMYFVNKGVKNPEQFIENSLREKPELIALRPTLGGKITFDNIQLLGDKWLIADYSDGHVSGRAIYSYNLNENNELEFKVLKSITP
jgi:dynactin complex subunit